MRWCGVAYLLWLAFEGWTQADTAPDAVPSLEAGRKYFLRGLITNMLNPKAALFYIAVLPAFVAKSAPPQAQAVALSLVYVTIATSVHLAIVVAAASMTSLLEDRARMKTVRRVLAASLAVIALWLAGSTAQ